MNNCHSTVQCPFCEKDSYASEAAAFFGVAECTWCGCEFTRDRDADFGTYRIIKEGNKNDSA